MIDENVQKHLNHPFYKDVNEYREKVRLGQIVKGASKYPEPFTTSSWSNEEIIEHAMQENVDQAHYIYAALERMQVLESEWHEAQKTIRELKAKDRVAKSLKLEADNLALAQENARLKELLEQNNIPMG